MLCLFRVNSVAFVAIFGFVWCSLFGCLCVYCELTVLFVFRWFYGGWVVIYFCLRCMLIC